MGIREFILEIKEEKNINVHTPYIINNDCDYVSELHNIYSKIERIAKKHQLNVIVEEIDLIKKAIELHTDGRIDEALDKVVTTISELIDNKYICSSFNKSGAFTNFSTEPVVEKVGLYRGRLGHPDDFKNEYSMYHIPFNMRERVDSQRFSIPGLPCLYIGKSIYTCWMELGQPKDTEFYVSKVCVEDNIRMFNLAINYERLFWWANSKELVCKIDVEKFLIDYTKVWILAIACSFKVKMKNRTFKSEYILPQLLMLSLKKLGIPAIAYYSKAFTEMEPVLNFAPLTINVAIIMDATKLFKSENNIYSQVMKTIDVGMPVNFATFKNIQRLRPTQKGKSDNSTINGKFGCSKHIGVGGQWIEYDNTAFLEFENFLEKDIDIMNEEATQDI